MLRQVGEEFITPKVKRQTNGELGSLQPPFLLLSCFAAASLALSLSSLPTHSGTTICSRQLGYQPTARFHEIAQPTKGRTIKDSNLSSIFPLWAIYFGVHIWTSEVSRKPRGSIWREKTWEWGQMLKIHLSEQVKSNIMLWDIKLGSSLHGGWQLKPHFECHFQTEILAWLYIFYGIARLLCLS